MWRCPLWAEGQVRVPECSGASGAKPRPATDAGWRGQGPGPQPSRRTSAESHRLCDPQAPAPGRALSCLGAQGHSGEPFASPSSASLMPPPQRRAPSPAAEGTPAEVASGPFEIRFRELLVPAVPGGRRGCKGGAESAGRTAQRAGAAVAFGSSPRPTRTPPVAPRVLLLSRHAPRISPGLQPSRLPGSSGLRRVLLFRLMLAVWGCRAGVRWRVLWPGFVRRPSRG